jgi:hypothetical protein
VLVTLREEVINSSESARHGVYRESRDQENEYLKEETDEISKYLLI